MSRIVVRDIAARRQSERERRIAARRAALLAPVALSSRPCSTRIDALLEWGGDWTASGPRPGPAARWQVACHSGRVRRSLLKPGAAGVGNVAAS